MVLVEKYFGRLIFPINNLVIENTWLHIEGNNISILIADPELNQVDWSIIWGEYNSLGTVSLLDCKINAQQNGFGGNYRKINVHKLIQGVKLNSIDQKVISKANITCPALNQWVFLGEFIDSKDHTYTIPKWSNFLNVKTEQFQIQFNSIYTGYSGSYDINYKREISICSTFSNPLSLSEFYIWKRKLEKLIVLLTNEDPSFQIKSINGNPHSIFGIDSIWESNRFTYNIDFNYSDISEQLGLIISKWFDFENLNPLINLISEKKENTNLSTARYFLNMSVAMESFHLNFIDPKTKLKNSDAIEKRKRIQELIIDDVKLLEWFNKQSAFWKKLDFIDRLLYFKNDLETIIDTSFDIEIDSLLTKIKNTRNKLAHEGKHNSEFSKEFSLFIIAYSLELLLKVRLIAVLGELPEHKIEVLLKSAKENVKLLATINNFKGIE